MNKMLRSMFAVLVLAGVSAGVARADSYDDTIHNFKQAGKSGTFFAKAYGYAVFPTVGGGGFIIGGAHGKGRVYAQGVLTGDTTVNLLSAGLPTARSFSSKTSTPSTSFRAATSLLARTRAQWPSLSAPKRVLVPAALAQKPVGIHRMPTRVAVITTVWRYLPWPKAA
jgi:hypothetical protein